jgi:ABC-type transporter MlaC component
MTRHPARRFDRRFAHRFARRFVSRAAAGVAALAIAFPIAVPAAAAEQEDRALAATEQLLSEAHAALTGAGGDAALRQAIDRAFAFDVWERFLIENRADRFTPEQRERFRALLPGYLAYLYHNQFDKGLDTPPAVGEAKPARKDVLVSATFKRANGGDLPVDWRLRDFPEQGMRVIDVMVGGTSFLLLKRDEFTSIIDNRGADGLLDFMQQHSL